MKLTSVIFSMLIAVAFPALSKSSDPVLIKVGKTEVSKSQFLYSLNKNNNLSDSSDDKDYKKKVEDYLGLYINMKLKVEGAKKIGIDTTSNFKRELASSRSSLARSYTSNDSIIEQIALDSYNRNLQSLEISHILIKLPSRSFTSDTLKAWNRAVAIRNKIIEGGDFSKIASDVSDDPYARKTEKGGYLGWYNTQVFVEPFEDAMFSLQEGEVSQPIRSSFGYHLIKLHTKSVNRGALTVAHIFLGKNDSNLDNDDKLKLHADFIYQRLIDGEDFAELCSQYSLDKSTSDNGGVIGAVELDSRIMPEIKNAIFSLKDVGDFSEPVKSPYGYHILKIIDVSPLKSWEDSKESLCDAVKKGYRRNCLDDKQFSLLSEKVGLSLNKELFTELLAVADSLYPYNEEYLEHFKSKKDLVLLTISEEELSLDSFLGEFSQQQLTNTTMSTDLIKDKLNSFSLMHLTKKEDVTLENRIPEFKFLVNEFYDGLLLFDFMNSEVWGKANSDIDSKESFLKKNRKRYFWDESRFCGSVVLCKDKYSFDRLTEAFPSAKYIKKDDLLNAFATDSLVSIEVEDKSWIKGENDFVDYSIFGGEVMPATPEDYPFYYIIGEVSKYPLSYSHADVYKIDSDYQDYLENKLMKRLKKEFKVKVDKKVFNSIITDYKYQ